VSDPLNARLRPGINGLGHYGLYSQDLQQPVREALVGGAAIEEDGRSDSDGCHHCSKRSRVLDGIYGLRTWFGQGSMVSADYLTTLITADLSAPEPFRQGGFAIHAKDPSTGRARLGKTADSASG
jgi:hypothetical protein